MAMSRGRKARWAVSLLSLTVVAGNAQAGNMILEYKFNETGTSAFGTGQNTTTLSMYATVSGIRTAKDLHGAAGSGVSGAAGDRSFVNIDATGMGGSTANPNSGDWVRSTSSISALTGLSSMTVSGWIKAKAGETVGNNARLIDYYDNTNAGGFRVIAPTNGKLDIYINGQVAPTVSTVDFTASGWMFFAISYDSAAKSVTYYYGTTDTSVKSLGTVALNAGAVQATTSPLLINGTYSDGNIRPFDGEMDNIRVHGSATDATGALGLAELESLRLADITVPEPASATFLAGGVCAVASLLRRRAR